MAIVKGQNAVQLVRQEYRYDANQRTNVVEREYMGSVSSALGLYGRTAGGTTSVSVQLDGGVGRVTTQSPVVTRNELADDGTTVRYEVATEFVEKDIFQIPDIAVEARRFNAFVDQSGSVDDPYYRELAEKVASRNILMSIDRAQYPLFDQVVRYLRDGVTGYELEYVVIKRSRRVSRSSIQGGIASIGDGLLYYSTGQLDLPNDVFFSVPDTGSLTPISADYAWGWRRRPSQCTIEGSYVEQSSEFILSQWSTLAYEPAGGFAGW